MCESVYRLCGGFCLFYMVQPKPNGAPKEKFFLMTWTQPCISCTSWTKLFSTTYKNGSIRISSLTSRSQLTTKYLRKHLGGADNKESTFFAECLQLYEQTLKKDVSSIESCHDRLSTLLDGNIGNKNSNPFSIFDGEAACK